MDEGGKETNNEENISNHDVWNSITKDVEYRMSSTMKKMEKGITETIGTSNLEYLEISNQRIRHDYEDRQKQKRLEMEKLTETSLHLNFKGKSTSTENDESRYIISPDSTEKSDLPVTSATILRKRKSATGEAGTKGKRTKGKKVSGNDGEASPDSSTNLFEGVFSSNLQFLGDLTHNYKKPLCTPTAEMITPLAQPIPNLGRIRVRDAQQLCSSRWRKPPLLSVPGQMNDSQIDNFTFSQQAPMSTLRACSNSINIPTTSCNSITNSTFALIYLDPKYKNVDTNRVIGDPNRKVLYHSMIASHANTKHFNSIQQVQMPEVQVSKSVYEQVINPTRTYPTLGYLPRNVSVSSNSTSKQNSCTYSPNSTLFLNNPLTSSSPNAAFSQAQLHPTKATNTTNPIQISNFPSFLSTSSSNLITSPLINATSINSDSPQALSSAQANFNSNEFGPSSLEQEVTTVISTLVQNTNNSNSNSKSYLLDLLQRIFSSIRSLNVFYKCIPTLNEYLSQHYFFENIMQLKRLFERLAIYENQPFSKAFINYIMQKFRGLTKFAPTLSSYEIDCILAFQPGNLRKWCSQSNDISRPPASMSSSTVVYSLRNSTPSLSTHQANNSQQNSNRHKPKVANKKLFTDLQLLVFKQQIESYKHITLWLNKRLNNGRPKQMVHSKGLKLVANFNRKLSEEDNNLIVSVTGLPSLQLLQSVRATVSPTSTSSEFNLKKYKTVPNAISVSNNDESTNPSVDLKDSNIIPEKTNALDSLNQTHDLPQISAINPLQIKSFTTSKDYNIPSIRDTVIVIRSEVSSSLGIVDEVECQLRHEKSTFKQKKVETSNNDSNTNPTNECERYPLQEDIVPMVRKDSITNLTDQVQNNSMDTLKHKYYSNGTVADNKQKDLPEDNTFQNTTSVTKIIKVIEKKHNSTTEDVSEIHVESGSAEETFCNSVLEVVEQNSSISLHVIELRESLTQDPEDLMEPTITSLVDTGELTLAKKLKYESKTNAIQKDIPDYDQMQITPLIKETKEFPIIMDVEIKADPGSEKQTDDKNLTDCSENCLLTEINEKFRTFEEEGVTVLDKDTENTVNRDEYYSEDSHDIRVKCDSQNPIKTEVPAILMVQSISCDQFNELNQIQVNDCDDSDSDTTSSCTIVEMEENGCLLCNDKSVFVCELCTKAPYCSKMCQETHWEIVHHKTCRFYKTDDIIVLDY